MLLAAALRGNKCGASGSSSWPCLFIILNHVPAHFELSQREKIQQKNGICGVPPELPPSGNAFPFEIYL